jgi:hypothetical protein
MTTAPLYLPKDAAALLRAVDSKIEPIQIWRTSEPLRFIVGTFCHSLMPSLTE